VTLTAKTYQEARPGWRYRMERDDGAHVVVTFHLSEVHPWSVVTCDCAECACSQPWERGPRRTSWERILECLDDER
jgi:hypothetical protein